MKVKDLMTPIGDYKTLGIDALLGDAAVLLTEAAHRDIVIVDAKGAFAGILTMTDVLMALEPNYKKLGKKDLDSDVLSNRFVADIFKEFDLWSDTLADMCEKGCAIAVADAMYVPDKEEYLDEEANLEHGVHNYIVGTHQPLVVRSNGQVVGLLRMADVFEEIIQRMNACACKQQA